MENGFLGAHVALVQEVDDLVKNLHEVVLLVAEHLDGVDELHLQALVRGKSSQKLGPRLALTQRRVARLLLVLASELTRAHDGVPNHLSNPWRHTSLE